MAYQPAALGNIDPQPNNPNQLVPDAPNPPILHLQAFSPLNQQIYIKLDTTNYFLWQTYMLNIIIENGLKGYIDGSILYPYPFLYLEHQHLNVEFTQWRRLNRLVMSYIYSSLTESMMGSIVGLNTA